jgi:hypothetical protein
LPEACNKIELVIAKKMFKNCLFANNKTRGKKDANKIIWYSYYLYYCQRFIPRYLINTTPTLFVVFQLAIKKLIANSTVEKASNGKIICQKLRYCCPYYATERKF